MQSPCALHVSHYTAQAQRTRGKRAVSRLTCQRVSVTVDQFVRVSVRCVVVNGSLDLTARAIVLQAFLFDLAKIDAATEFRCAETDEPGQRRARYKALKRNRTLQLFRDTRPDLSFFFCTLLALKLSLARCYRWRAASSPSKSFACEDLVSPRAERKVHNVSQACDAQPDHINSSGDRRPRITLRAEAAAYAMLALLSTRIT
jgi:hypothetical protein